MSDIPPMSPVLAEVTFTRTRPDGVQTPILVQVGVPAPIPPGADVRGWYSPEASVPGWYVTVRFVGLTHDAEGNPSDEVEVFCDTHAIYALSMALCFPGVILSSLPYRQEIDGHVLPNFGFPYMPDWPLFPGQPPQPKPGKKRP